METVFSIGPDRSRLVQGAVMTPDAAACADTYVRILSVLYEFFGFSIEMGLPPGSRQVHMGGSTPLGAGGMAKVYRSPCYCSNKTVLGNRGFVACGDSIEFEEVTVMKTHRIVALSVSGLLGLAGASAAATIVLKGRSTWTPVSETSIKLADGRTVARQVLRGTALNDNPNTPLSNASQDCMFTTVTSADGKSFSSGGYCDGLDADGDVYWAYGSATEKGGKWNYLGGTGKFEGLTGGGAYRLALNWPDGKVMATWDGSAQMK